MKTGESAEFETTFFNDTFNILNQKQVVFLRRNKVILAFVLSQLIDRKRSLQILKTNIEEQMIEKLTLEES